MARNKTEKKITLEVPESFTAEQRSAVAEDVIEFITNRTRSGYNVFGRDWSGKAGQYTDQYANRKGVRPGGPVDLSLSFDILDDLQYFSSQSGKGKVTIGFRKGSKSERKAEGNILGTYGQSSPIPGKARPFLDILKKDLKPIVDQYNE